MPGIHQTLALIILVVGGLTLILGIVCIVISRRAASADISTLSLTMPFRVFRIALWVIEGIGVLQAIFGLLLLRQGDHPGTELHFVYGFIVLGAIPVAYVYSDQKDVRRDIIIMTIAVILVVAAGVRAFFTGGAA